LPDALRTAVNTTRLGKLKHDLKRVMNHLGLSNEEFDA
jgi:hypothetical protein